MEPRERRRGGTFIKPFDRGFGVLWNRAGHRFRAWSIGMLALLGCWTTLVPGYVWIVEPPHVVGAAARWTAAAAFAAVGLPDWRWSVDTNGGPQRWRSVYVRHDPWHLAQAEMVFASTREGVLVASGVTILLGVIGGFLIRRTGKVIGTEKVIRGRRLGSDKSLARTLRKEGVASELSLGRVPLIKDMEPYNLLLLGAQGTGKTSAIEALMQGISERGEPMVIYDYGPSLLPRFFNAERGDIILNPLDERSAVWSPWAEIRSSADCTAIAEGFIPERDQAQPFWGDAGRLLFAEALDRFRSERDRSVTKLLHMLLRMSHDEIRDMLKGTNAAKLYDDGAERTGKSVEIHASIYIKALGQLMADAGGENDFSITRYVEALDDPAPAKGRPWLWLTTDPRSAPTLRPLLSCWTNAVASAFLSLPERLDRRFWFALDELATLHELPALPSLMQNARKRGGSAIITLQTPSQLRAIYDEADARTILNGCQTQAIFRVSDAEGAEWASRELSSVEVEELQESTRLHAQGQRGYEVSLSTNTRVKPLVMPAEITMTPNCQCYVKLPANRPVVMTEITPRGPLSGAEPSPGFLTRQDDSRIAEAALALTGKAEKPNAARPKPSSPAPAQKADPPSAPDGGKRGNRRRAAGTKRGRSSAPPNSAKPPADDQPMIPGLVSGDRSKGDRPMSPTEWR